MARSPCPSKLWGTENEVPFEKAKNDSTEERASPSPPKCKDLKPDLGLDVGGSQPGRVKRGERERPSPIGQGRKVSQLQEGPDKCEQQGKEM